MNTDGILAPDGTRFSAFPLSGAAASGRLEFSWRGHVYKDPFYAGEWMEALDGGGRQVGVQVDLMRELHPSLWEWLHQFSNVTFDQREAPLILFGDTAAESVSGPYLPVYAFQCETGEYAIPVRELWTG